MPDEQDEVQQQGGPMPAIPLPTYLMIMGSEELKDEARRTYALEFMLDRNDILRGTWKTDLPDLVKFLKDGTLNEPAKVLRMIKGDKPE